MRVAALAGCSPYQRLTPERLAKVLLSERGLQKGRPEDARFAVVLTQVTEANVSFAQELVGLIGTHAKVVILR